jgi:hypothetical protein
MPLVGLGVDSQANPASAVMFKTGFLQTGASTASLLHHAPLLPAQERVEEEEEYDEDELEQEEEEADLGPTVEELIERAQQEQARLQEANDALQKKVGHHRWLQLAGSSWIMMMYRAHQGVLQAHKRWHRCRL